MKKLREAVSPGHSVLLDGGDLWQGSGLANLTNGRSMVQAANLLGIDAMTGHFEFTYGEETLRKNLDEFKGEFLAQNVFLTEEAKFNDVKAFDPDSGRAFKPYTIKEMALADVRFKADIRGTPTSVKCQHATSRALSGLTRRVTIDRVNGPINDLLGKRDQPCRYFETECFRRPRVDDYHELSGCCTGKSAGFSPLRIRLT